jgi:hypothetical protein
VSKYLVVLKFNEPVTPGHRTLAMFCDDMQEAVKEIRQTLAERGVHDECEGEWGVILSARDGLLRRRYVIDRRGIVCRV